MKIDGPVLFIRLKSIGDILFALPAVSLVRDNLPQARIEFLTSREHAPLLRGFAEVDEVLTLDRDAFRQRNPLAICRATFNLARRLRRARYALAVDFQGYGETAWLTRLTGAPQRWGSVYRPGRAWAYTRGIRRNDAIHPAEWNRSLLVECGLEPKPVRNRFCLPDEAIAAARAFCHQNGLSHQKLTLYLQPFTSSPSKNWPLAKYLELAHHWHERGVQVLLSGGPADRPVLAPACAAGFLVAAGVPRLTDAGLMKLSSLIVGGDTGFIHLAVAMGKRALMLLQAVGPGTAIPFGHPDWVVAPRRGLPMAAIEVAEVIQASAAAFRESSSP